MIAVAGLLSTARAGERGLTRGVGPGQALELAAELLREELGLAAFVPYVDDPGSDGAGSAGGGATGGSTPATGNVVVGGAGAASNTFRVAYVDDRLATGPITRDLTFSTGIDGRGEAQLYRRSAGGSRQPLVAGIAKIRLTAYIDDSGLHSVASSAGGASVPAAWALLVEISAPTNDVRTLLIELPSRPGLVIEP